ncbi:hypothetical protein MSG28_008948 [Choristoneura fumiferana]|uniref:Uncharacterized protein n=2 Tax=Choristoneura fumiferana TaxID=7141 RepID=A0ACC0J8M1_CHOFU|nr:hypothetical protein MSG28_008948 [Choristoneura fumiferana]KAI8420461.1 hypothetical protein MSG28_008948 [Choristoneura fumiferana]
MVEGKKPPEVFSLLSQDVNGSDDCQTLIHLLKSTLGSGIMTMPYAFRSVGIVGGILGGFFIDCAHVLYNRTHKTKMDYADVTEAAFATGPKWCRKFSKFARYFVLIWLFSVCFGACSTDNLLIATNYGQVVNYFMKHDSLVIANSSGGPPLINETVAAELALPPEESLQRIIMSCLMIPIILFVWVPDLKYLAPISSVANVFMATVIGITGYFLVQNPEPMSNLSLFEPISVTTPQFFSMTIFAMGNIGVIMPLENSMKTPRNLLGTCGVLNRGMFSITFVYLLFGVLGYMKYGSAVHTVITTNLPVDHIAAQVVKVLIGSTVLFTFSLQFYVCRDMFWTRVKKYFPSKPLLAEYIIRALLVIACVSVAIALPKIGPLVELLGALGFSVLGILGPVIIEVITYWDIGFGRYNWRLYKNAFILIVGSLFLIFGTYSAIIQILQSYFNLSI